jgi:multidrug transporter EmrE-like cation transporter
VAAGLCACGAAATYRPGFKEQTAYPFVMAGLAVLGGLWYGFAVRCCRTAGEVFALSVAWDVIAGAVYVLVPVACFGLRLSPAGWVGLALAAIGIVLLKVSVGK